MTFSLFKEEEVIYNHTCIRGKNATNCEPPYTRVGVELREDTENKSASFKLTGVNAISYGIYRCVAIVNFPPPLRKVPSALRILVRVEGHQCKITDKGSPKDPITDGDQKDGSLWIWIPVLVVLGIYSLIVTIISCVNWSRLDSQSDYMNTKPKAPRDRKKKRGVQIPVPRHF